jgi:hypothetical protein
MKINKAIIFSIVIFLLIIFAVAYYFTLFSGKPIPVGTDFLYYGHINNGSKFGVKIGQDVQSSLIELKKRNLYKYNDRNYVCTDADRSLFGCRVGDKFEYEYIRVEDAKHDGYIILLIENEKVTAIIWSLPPISFNP